MSGVLPTESNIQMAGAGIVGSEAAGLSSRIAFADLPALMSVYTEAEVDAIIGGLTFLTSDDLDTLAELNAILTDANFAAVATSGAYADLTGLPTLGTAAATDAGDYATAAQGATADSALQPADIASGIITPRTGAIDLSGGSDGDVLAVQSDGSLALETPSGGGGSPGGSSGQLQYNDAGTFGGTTAVVYAGSGTHVAVTAQSAAAVPLCVKGAASQTANLLEVKHSAGTNLSYIDSAGRVCVGTQGLRSTSDPANRWIDPASKWYNNLATEIYSVSAVYLRATNTQSGFRVASEQLSANLWGTGDKTATFSGWDTDAVASRGVCDTVVRGGTAHPNGQTNTSQTVRGGKLTLRGGDGSANATTAAADGGDVVLTPGSHYGTGRQGLVLISSLPTADPSVAGALWNDSGTLKISAG